MELFLESRSGVKIRLGKSEDVFWVVIGKEIRDALGKVCLHRGSRVEGAEQEGTSE